MEIIGDEPSSGQVIAVGITVGGFVSEKVIYSYARTNQYHGMAGYKDNGERVTIWLYGIENNYIEVGRRYTFSPREADAYIIDDKGVEVKVRTGYVEYKKYDFANQRAVIEAKFYSYTSWPDKEVTVRGVFNVFTEGD